jgi:hypothetical protein
MCDSNMLGDKIKKKNKFRQKIIHLFVYAPKQE